MLNLINRFRTPPTGASRPRLSPLDGVSSQAIPSNIVDEIMNRQHQRYQILQSIPETRVTQSAPAGSQRPTRHRHRSIPRPRQRPTSNRIPMRSRADSNPSGGIDLSMTERENFDLALGIQASIGEIETTGDRVTNTNVNRPVRPVRQTSPQPPTEESQPCCPICLDVIVRGGTGGDRSRMATCGHVFHRKCLRKWKQARIQQNRTYECPVCRHVLS